MIPFLGPCAKAYRETGAPVPKEWQGEVVPFHLEQTVLDLLHERVHSAPDAPAIEGLQRTLSYADLDESSSNLAAELLRRGLKVEEPVPVLLHSSPEYIVAILAVLKAGGSYLPIEMETPLKRLEFILGDSQCRFVVTDAAGAERLRSWKGEALNVSVLERIPAKEFRGVPSDPRRRIYIAYTSGSTGLPKGVEIEHRCVLNIVGNYIQQLQLGARDRSSMLTHLGFDVSVADIWPVLCAGGTIVVPPEGLRHNPDELIAWLHAQAITLTFIPTGLAELLFSRPWPERMALRFFTTGGDRLRVHPPAGLPFKVINGYGPTECTVFGTWSVVSPKTAGQRAPPIGRPLWNTRAYVLDEHRQPLPVGEPGELYLAGAQVGRGYLGRTDLTDSVFFPDPFAAQSGERMYRTGDWARWLEDGELEFLGRRDSQIQVRGFRVELGEIEAVLFDHPSVRQACCVPLLDDGMPMGTAAHVVASSNGIDIGEKLRAHLTERLPEAMIPLKFVAHERLPLTPQGKVDRAALMALGTVAQKSAAAPITNDLDSHVSRLWFDTLPASAAAVSGATFWELGGDSLLAMKLLLRVEELTGSHVEYSTFLRQPTLSGVFQALRGSAENLPGPVVALRAEGSRPPLFCLHNIAGFVDVYTHLAEALDEDQPVYGICSPALSDPSKIPGSIEDAASSLIEHIRAIQPRGAPALVGFSWAGWLAFELARQFFEREGLSCFCAMIGSNAPSRACSRAFRVRHFFSALPALCRDVMTEPRGLTRRLSIWRKIVRARGNAANPDSAPIPTTFERRLREQLTAIGAAYRPPSGTRIPICLFRELAEYSARRLPLSPGQTDYLPDYGWSYWTSGKIDLHWIAGNHANVLSYPNVVPLAHALREASEAHRRDALR